MRKFQVGAAAIAVLLTSSLLSPSVAAAAAPGGSTTDTIVYQRNLDYLAGAQLHTEKGERDADGCRFASSGHHRRTSNGPQVLVFTEVSYTPSTCTRTVASAAYAPDAVPARIKQKLDRGDPKSGSDSKSADTNLTAPGGSGTQNTPYVGQGFLQVWFEDPVYIDIALTRSTLHWNWSYPDLLLAGTTYHQAYWYWFGLSGWRLNSSNQQFYFDGDLAVTDTIGHFSNPIFCLGDTTYADHYQTMFYAADWGYWGWSYIVSKSGGCSGPIQMPGFYSWAITVV